MTDSPQQDNTTNINLESSMTDSPKQDSTTNINLESSMKDDPEITDKLDDEYHNNQVVDQIIDTTA